MAVNPSYSGAMSGLARALVQHGRLAATLAEELVGAGAQPGHGLHRAPRGEPQDEHRRGRRVRVANLRPAAARPGGARRRTRLPLNLIDKKLMRERRVLPLRKRGNRLAVAVSDPSNTQVLDEVKFQTSMSIDADRGRGRQAAHRDRRGCSSAPSTTAQAADRRGPVGRVYRRRGAAAAGETPRRARSTTRRS